MSRLMQIAVSFLFVGLFLVCALETRKAAAQERKIDREPTPISYLTARFLVDILGLEHPPLFYEIEEERSARRERDQLWSAYVRADQALRDRNPQLFRFEYETLKRLQRRSSARTRDYADSLVWSLPEKYVHGFAYRELDGTVVADPDPRIQGWLRAQVDVSNGGDGAGGVP